MSFLFRDQAISVYDYNAKAPFQYKIQKGSVAVDPASLAANTSAETAVTILGLQAGDFIMFDVPASLEAGLAFSGCRVSAANTAQIRLSNLTAGAIDGASRTWTYVAFIAQP